MKEEAKARYHNAKKTKRKDSHEACELYKERSAEEVQSLCEEVRCRPP